MDTHLGAIYGISVSADGTTVATLGLGGEVRVWSPSGTLIQEWRIENYATNLALSDDGSKIVIADAEQNLQVWSIKPAVKERTIKVGFEGINDLSFSGYQNEISALVDYQNIVIWNSNGKIVHRHKLSLIHI